MVYPLGIGILILSTYVHHIFLRWILKPVKRIITLRLRSVVGTEVLSLKALELAQPVGSWYDVLDSHTWEGFRQDSRIRTWEVGHVMTSLYLRRKSRIPSQFSHAGSLD